MNRKGKILWVDDDALLLEPLVTPLKDSGYYIRIAFDAAEALDALRSEPFDLLLLDIYLPVGNCPHIDKALKYIGIEILKLMSLWDIKVPTIVFSVVRASELGDLTDFGVKKILYKARLPPDELLEIVEEILEIS